MAPNGEILVPSYAKSNNFSKPPRLSMENIQRTVSDLSLEFKKAAIDINLPVISEVEDAKCECCGMSEECTPEYVQRVRGKFSGKWICGLCSEAVKEEVGKNGGKAEEALNTHMDVCVRFNRTGRAYPVLYQAEAMRQILKKSSRERAKSFSPKDRGNMKKGGIARSSSCIPAITKEMTDQK